MKKIILIKYGEMALKGLNRKHFEDMLCKRLKTALKPCGDYTSYSAQSTLVIEPKSDDFDYEKAEEIISKIFGIATYASALICEKNIDKIKAAAPEYLAPALNNAKTFKVNTKRSDKRFPMKSPEICNYMGEVILENFPHLKVDVHNPEVTVTVEIRDYSAFIRATENKGAGGMPNGSAGRGMLLISGGIDSPVAGYMMAKRGLSVDGIHFFSYPYTSIQAKEKVIELGKILAQYLGYFNLHIVPFTKIQEAIRQYCPDDLFTLVMRRSMMRIAEKLAVKYKSGCLITGESLGQVASQTLAALNVTDNAAKMPVFRPCIGMDKEEIVQISRAIGAFETSILPYEDCCTVFTPKHPKTNPKIDDVVEAEKAFDIISMEETAFENIEYIKII